MYLLLFITLITALPVFADTTITAYNDTYESLQDVGIIISPAENDTLVPDSLDYTVTILTGNTLGNTILQGDGKTISYTPPAGYVGNDTVWYKICFADTAICDSAKIIITLLPNAPDAVNDLVNTNEDASVNINVLLNDVITFGLQVTVTITQSPKKGTAVLQQNNTITYTPSLNYNGFDTLKYRVCLINFQNKCDEATVYIQVNPVDDKPIAVNDEAYTPKNESVEITVLSNDTDIDAKGLTLGIVEQTKNGLLVISGNLIEYFPDEDFVGIDTGYYQICNATAPGFCDTARIIIFVGTDNNPPVAQRDTIIIDENDNSVNILNNDSDPDGDELNYEIITQAKYSTLQDDGNGNITYIPGNTFAGIDSFQYRLCDKAYFSECSEAWVLVKAKDVTIQIPNSFSPNGDGVNDVFIIKNLIFYPDNELQIFNRWGELVLKQRGYDNTWQGELRGAKRTTWGNEQVQDGSYFYILTINGKDTYKGYIVIKR